MELPQRIDITSGVPLALASIVFHSCFFFTRATDFAEKEGLSMYVVYNFKDSNYKWPTD